MNLYGYCGSGPVGAVDASGLRKRRDDAGFEAIISQEVEPTWDEIAANGFTTSWAMLGSFLSDAVAGIANDYAKAPLGILAPFVDGPFHGWDGGEYANEQGASESKIAWRAAAVAYGLKGTCELVNFNPSVHFWKYPRAGGGGVVVLDTSGSRAISFDVHPWTQKGSRTSPRTPAPKWKWPHIDVPPAGKHHWPWE